MARKQARGAESTLLDSFAGGRRPDFDPEMKSIDHMSIKRRRVDETARAERARSDTVVMVGVNFEGIDRTVQVVKIDEACIGGA